jgi:hypothetical protein
VSTLASDCQLRVSVPSLDMNGEERAPKGGNGCGERGEGAEREWRERARRGEERENRAWRPTEALRMSQQKDKDAMEGSRELANFFR